MKKFQLTRSTSPTHANLAHFLKLESWKPSRFSHRAIVNDNWLNFPANLSNTLEYKHLLAAFLQKNQIARLMPETFFVDDHIWPCVLTKIKKYRH